MKIAIFVLLVCVVIVSAGRKGHWKRKNKCRYNRGEWGKCDDSIQNQEVSMTLTIKPGSPETCAPSHVKTISCTQLKMWQSKKDQKHIHKEQKKRLKNHKKLIKEKFGLGCKYEISVSDCNKETNLVTKTFTPVQSADTTVCTPQSISYSCEFHKKVMLWKEKRRQNIKDKRKNKRKDRKQHKMNKRMNKRNHKHKLSKM